jgi:hypothetical protein
VKKDQKKMKLISKVRNELFQFVWFIVRGFIPRKIGDGTQLSHYAPRMIAQVILSWLFGGPFGVLLGDSNSEVFSKYRVMRKFDSLFVSLGVGGTRVDQWYEFLKTRTGKIILFLLGSAHRVVNVGGNNVLQLKMDAVLSALSGLYARLDNKKENKIIAILIPPIHFDLFTANGWPLSLRADVEKVNSLIRIFFPIIIDPTPLVDLDNDGYPDPLALSDPIHYATGVVYKLQDLIQQKLGL